MPTYKFQIGQTVFLGPSHNLNIPGGACIVTKKLPGSNGKFEYRVRIVRERVVRESELQDVPWIGNLDIAPKQYSVANRPPLSNTPVWSRHSADW